MRGRLIFPVLDATGSPRGFAGRLLAGEGPKYLNGPETALYTKRSLLYGLDLAQPGITKTGQAIVVEGYTDVIAAHRTGFTNVVGTAGTALTEQHLDLLARTTTNVVLAFDGDPAGLQAIERSVGLLRNTPLQIRVAALPGGHDPADLLTSSEPDRFNAAIDQARPIAWHLIDAILQQHNLEELGAATRAVISAAPLIDPLNPDRRSEAVAYLANRLGHDPTAVADTIQRYANRPGRRRGQSLSRGLA